MQDDPIDRETFEVLKEFVGTTYSQISQYDSSLTEVGMNVRPIKNQFKDIANKVFSEVNPQNIRGPQYHNQPPQYPQNHPVQDVRSNLPYIDRGVPPQPPVNDPNQMEFNFTKTKIMDDLEKKIDIILNKVNKIDKALEALLEFVNYDVKNSES